MEHLDLGIDKSRRVFISGLGLVAVDVLIGTSLGGCESLVEQIGDRPVRRRLRTGSPEVDADIATYREAVRLMRLMQPPTDGRSWSSQAIIHGTFAGGFNLCQHDNDRFFGWHRAYVTFFEKICQTITGNLRFGLPYWNWNLNPAIHPAFLDTSSPLYRARTRTSVAGNEQVSNAALNTIFSDNNFITFSRQLEGTPHNHVHSFIGGDFAEGNSAQDALFWVHHCMIDYCWTKWSFELGNDTPNNPAWRNTSWNHFVDRDGSPATITQDVTTVLPMLTYQYESSAIGNFPATLIAQTKNDFNKLKQRVEAGADIKLDVKRRIFIAEGAELTIQRPFSKTLSMAPADVSSMIEIGRTQDKLFVSVEAPRLPNSTDFFVRVFINLPSANLNTSTSDPHYAGSFAFFGTNSTGAAHEQHGRLPFLVNATQTIRTLLSQEKLSRHTPISVQLVAVPYDMKTQNGNMAFNLGRVEFLITPILIRRR